MLLFLATVFVYTSGDLFAERFLKVQNFDITNPTILITYIIILLYFVIEFFIAKPLKNES